MKQDKKLGEDGYCMCYLQVENQRSIMTFSRSIMGKNSLRAVDNNHRRIYSAMVHFKVVISKSTNIVHFFRRVDLFFDVDPPLGLVADPPVDVFLGVFFSEGVLGGWAGVAAAFSSSIFSASACASSEAL